MPKLKEFKPQTKKFSRVVYTPWDLSPDISISSSKNKNSHTEPETKWKQSDNKVVTEPETKWKQSDNGVNLSTTLPSLIGIQKLVMIFLFRESKKSRDKNTECLTLEYISSSLKKPKHTIKTTIQRLEKKRMLVRVRFKNGRGGWSQYCIPDPIFKELLNEENLENLETKWKQSDNKVDTKPETKTTILYSSSSSNINTTTTEDEFISFQKNNSIPLDWQNIDITPLKEQGLCLEHLIQVHRVYNKKPEISLTIDIIQNSINSMAYDIKHNDITKSLKSSPVAVLTSLLKKGMPYSSKTPEKVVSPRDEALNVYLAIKEQQRKQRLAQEEKLEELEFSEWFDNLNDEKLKKEFEFTVGRFMKGEMRQRALRETAKEHWINKIWPEKKNTIIQEITKEVKR